MAYSPPVSFKELLGPMEMTEWPFLGFPLTRQPVCIGMTGNTNLCLT